MMQDTGYKVPTDPCILYLESCTLYLCVLCGKIRFHAYRSVPCRHKKS